MKGVKVALLVVLFSALSGCKSEKEPKVPSQSMIRPDVRFRLADKEVQRESTNSLFRTTTRQEIQAFGPDSAGIYLVVVDAWESVAPIKGEPSQNQLDYVWVVGGQGSVTFTSTYLPCSNQYAALQDACIDSYIDPLHSFRIEGFVAVPRFNENMNIAIEPGEQSSSLSQDRIYWSTTTKQTFYLENADSNRSYLIGFWRDTEESRVNGRGWTSLEVITSDSITVEASDFVLRCGDTTTENCQDSYEDPNVQWRPFGLVPLNQIDSTGQVENAEIVVEIGRPKIVAESSIIGWTRSEEYPVFVRGAAPLDIHVILISLTQKEESPRTAMKLIRGNRGAVVMSRQVDSCEEQFEVCLEEPKSRATAAGLLRVHDVHSEDVGQ